ncbi:amidase [Polaromonas sp. C04]|uniref:amidase n=1 Tax=Polaromonas sp. C04 TaxID=1945857 RepID=UPI0009864066|nr:amidase [Polaromonas sp. C04]OOG50402.1 amidase [Polaromonas sp. C04]
MEPLKESIDHASRGLPESLPFWQWSGTDMAQAVRTGVVSARELTLAHLERIAQTNPVINALVEVSGSEALVMADAADAAVARGEQLPPLHGVPVAIKVNADQQGHATTDGIVALSENVAASDGPQVATLRRAGAVLIGRSNTPSFSLRWFTENDLHGRTLNPWDPARTPGGSSGGAAAAVAAGMVPIAQGSDIGGSIRNPAYSCGVVGLRPTAGRVPGWYGPVGADPALSSQLMLANGPLARCVKDLRLALSVMSRFDPRDPLSSPVVPCAQPLSHALRVGLVRGDDVARPAAAVNSALDSAAKWLSDAGYQVDEIALPQLQEAYRLWYLIALEEFRQVLPEMRRVGDSRVCRAAAHYFAIARGWWGKTPGLEAYMTGYARRGTLIAQLEQLLHDTPLILLPVSSEQSFEYDLDIVSVDSMRRVAAANWSMMAIALLGMPAAAVPTGIANGLPVGVQLMAGRWRDELVLHAADVIEERAGVITPIDPIGRAQPTARPRG